ETTASHWTVRVVRAHSVPDVGALIVATRVRTIVATPPPRPSGRAGATAPRGPCPPRAPAPPRRRRPARVSLSAQPAAIAPRTSVVAKKWTGTTGVFQAGTVTRE